jgi:acyl-CoA synthetase (AMP-forming)/AMP-acid ligase II
VAINTRLSTMEIEYVLAHSGARVLLLGTDIPFLAETALAMCPDLRLIVEIGGGSRGGPEYEAFLAAANADLDLSWPSSEDDPISINYTSGTTGRPKGVVYSHRGAYLNALNRRTGVWPHAPQRVPVDLADVPLQRLVLSVGCYGTGSTQVSIARPDPGALCKRICGPERRHRHNGLGLE